MMNEQWTHDEYGLYTLEFSSIIFGSEYSETFVMRQFEGLWYDVFLPFRSGVRMLRNLHGKAQLI